MTNPTPELTLGPARENHDKLLDAVCDMRQHSLAGGGVYRRLIWYKSRPIGWIAYGINRYPNQVNLYMQDYKGYISEQDIVTYETEGAALLAAHRFIKQLLGEP